MLQDDNLIVTTYSWEKGWKTEQEREWNPLDNMIQFK